MNPVSDYITHRPRRNRKSPAVRALVQETRLHPSNFVAPLFVTEGPDEPIPSMPGVNRLSLESLAREAKELYTLGIPAIDLFTVIPPQLKSPSGAEAIRCGNLLHRAIDTIKEHIPEMCVMVDVALDPYTDHGHDGLMDEWGEIDNDATIEVLTEMSILAADAGADVIAPSDMMDGRVGCIRRALDEANYQTVNILSYTAKYASAFYGPFRDALNSAPKMGDKKSYQMNPANRREALFEMLLDEEEGADMHLVKPALAYLDIVAALKEASHLPVGAYHVSGEYSMIMAAAEKGWIDGDKALMESLLCIRRAGADFILTYGAKKAAELIHTNLF